MIATTTVAVVVSVLTCTVGAWSPAAAAQHGAAERTQHPSPAKPAPPAGGGHAAATPAKPAATPPPAEKPSSPAANDLKSALARIDQQIKDGHQPAKRDAAAAGAPARIRLQWRIDLTWPTTLEQSPKGSSDGRVLLDWRK